MPKIKYFFNNSFEKTDFSNALKLYREDIDPEKFAQELITALGYERCGKVGLQCSKTGAFSIIFKIIISDKENSVYFLKFFRNKSPVKKYTPERMKALCIREFLILKAAEAEFRNDDSIDVVKPKAIISDMACLITEECHGSNFNNYVNNKIKRAFLTPFISWEAKYAPLHKHIRDIARLLAVTHELNLDYEFFKEEAPFYVLDFDYKKEKFINAVIELTPERKDEAVRLLDKLTKKAEMVFPLLRSTGIACPDTNLTNFIIDSNKIYMMDFFLSQYGPAYLSTGKFLACLELMLYPFTPMKIITALRTHFIDTYNQNAQKYKLDKRFIDFFISWNYMTAFPRSKSVFKRYYHKRLFDKKVDMIFADWRNYLN